MDSEVQSKVTYFSFNDMIKSNKNFFSDLIQKYQPLLAELSINDNSPAVSGNKDNLKQMFMESTIGGKLKTDKLKLSDFIDESFFEDIDDNQPDISVVDKLNVQQLAAGLRQRRIIEVPTSTKRVKTSL